MKLSFIAYLLFVCAFIGACESRKADVVPANACTTPATVSFSHDLIPLFSAHCALSGCHAGSQPAANLNLEASAAYTQLMKPGTGYVDTIHPSYSLLYAQMNSSSDPMPPTGKLDACTLNLVFTWIQQKAKNN